MRDVLIAVAAMFAVATGTNDGSAILAAGLRVPGLRPVASLTILLTAVIVGPLLLFGTGVATTLAHGLVPIGRPGADQVVLVALVSAMAVVFLLAKAGLPTSLTLGLVGALTGAGLGAGLPVRVGTLTLVFVFGLLAPVVSAALVFAIAPALLRVLGGGTAVRRARRVHVAAFSLQCLAYSANGGQKMLAVFAIAAGAAATVSDPWWLALGIAVLFGIGTLTGLRRVADSLGKEVLAVHLRHVLVAEACSSAVVAAAGVVDVPLTMSQSVAGALVGAGASEARHRVRWPEAARMAGAWIVTMPASIGVAALAGAMTR
jgi:PiT family inorganic phosphate transporter